MKNQFAFKTLMLSMFSGLVATTLVSFNTPASAVVLGNDEVNFDEVKYDFPNQGQSTWFYTLISGEQPAISHVIYELNLDCLDIVNSGIWQAGAPPTLGGGGSPVKVEDEDPTTGLAGLKFNQGFSDNETRQYYFVLDGNYDRDEMTVATKSGNEDIRRSNRPDPSFASITGPSFNCALVQSMDVELDELQAKSKGKNIQVSWKTKLEKDTAKFNLWRAQVDANGEYTDIVKLTESGIPARGHDSSYIYIDTTAAKGIKYYYAIEDIDMDGNSDYHLEPEHIGSATRDK